VRNHFHYYALSALFLFCHLKNRAMPCPDDISPSGFLQKDIMLQK